MPAKKKAELIEEAEAAGVDVPEDATVPEIKEALADAEADVDAGLPGTPVVGDAEYAPLDEPHEVDPLGSDESGPDHEADGRSLPGTPA